MKDWQACSRWWDQIKQSLEAEERGCNWEPERRLVWLEGRERRASRGMGGQVGKERVSEIMLRNVDFMPELGAGE